MTGRIRGVHLDVIAANLADMVTSGDALDSYITVADVHWLVDEVKRLRALTDIVPVGEAAALLDIKPASVRHLMRRHGVTEVRGYPRAAVTGLRRTPPGRKRTP
jgi:hypothetical protein